MQQYIQTITRYFFEKDDLEQVSKEELQDFIASYPYSSAGHFLLTKKLHHLDQAAFSQQAAVTSLYFSNPLWLHWILRDSSGNNHDQLAGEDDTTITHAETATSEESAIIDEEAVNVIDHPLNKQSFPGTINIREEERTDEETTPQVFFTEKNILEDEQAEGPVPTAETITEPFSIKENPAPGEEQMHSAAGDQTSGSSVPSPDDTVTEDVAANVQDHQTSGSSAASLTGATTEQAAPGAPADHQPGEPVFQSYHTIDYFASQGIRLRQEDLLKDRFGQQVKSFTEWLRNMKRITPPAFAGDEESSNASIREIADHSFNEKEVITETMAEVWLKQGNREKAIAVYEKLSLLNPAKSAYFAAKIEQLKA